MLENAKLSQVSEAQFLKDVRDMINALAKWTPGQEQSESIARIWLRFVLPKVTCAWAWEFAVKRALDKMDTFPSPAAILELLREFPTPKNFGPDDLNLAVRLLYERGWMQEFEKLDRETRSAVEFANRKQLEYAERVAREGKL